MEPVIIKEDLSQERLAQVQSLVEDLVNKKVLETPSLLPTQASGFTGVPPTEAPNSSITSQTKAKKYQICVIENGKLRIPEEDQEALFDSSVKNCSIDQVIYGAGTSIQTDEQKSDPTKSVPYQTTENKTDDKGNIPNSEPSSESSSNWTFHESKQPQSNNSDFPKVEPLDNDVMSSLLDYYRRFNERQLGIAVDKDAPRYTKSQETPVDIICDNDIIKEAVLRVGQKQEAGEIIREPTIIELDSEYDKEPEIGWKAVELERQRQEYTQINVEDGEEDVVEEFDCATLYQCKDRQNYEEEWIFGANFIEKTLQKRIDEDKIEQAKIKKWEKEDIVKLVQMLSQEREQRQKKASTRDDLVKKLDNFGNSEDFKGDSLFDALKRGEYVNDDASELKKMVSENCYKFKAQRVVSKNKKVYYGGDELVIVMDSIKNLFKFHWFWDAYDKLLGRWFTSHETLNYGRDSESRWFQWKTKLSQVRWLTDWLPHSWRVGITGKPIYRQMTNQSSEDAGSWSANSRDDSGIRNFVKNRRRKVFREKDEHTYPIIDEDCYGEETERADDESVVIDVDEGIMNEADDSESDYGFEEGLEGEVEDEEEQEDCKEERNDVDKVRHYEEEDVIANFRKMRSECPSPRRFYLD